MGNTSFSIKVIKSTYTEALFCELNPNHRLGKASQPKTFGYFVASQSKLREKGSEVHLEPPNEPSSQIQEYLAILDIPRAFWHLNKHIWIEVLHVDA